MWSIRKGSSKCLGNLTFYQNHVLNASIDFTSLRLYHQNANGKTKEVERDLILSVLESQPTARDSRSYLKAFSPTNANSKPSFPFPLSDPVMPTTAFPRPQHLKDGKTRMDSLFDDLRMLPNSPSKIGVIVIQGPFDENQTKSIIEGILQLKKLGLGSVILADHEEWEDKIEMINNSEESEGGRQSSREQLRRDISRTLHRLSEAFSNVGETPQPLFQGIFDDSDPKLSIEDDSLASLKSSVLSGIIPIIPPIALSNRERFHAIPCSQALRAVCAELQPIRIIFINRHGGIPSPARGGDPHVSINLESEMDFIENTWKMEWGMRRLKNLRSIKSALEVLPRESSALVLGGQAQDGRKMVGNLVTGKPTVSPSLRIATGTTKYKDNPTIVRLGYPIKVIRNVHEIDRSALAALLECSFGRVLQEEYWTRLEKVLDFMIIVGDYKACAIVTLENDPSFDTPPISYLDKFAVLPSLQGEGTVDFLWGALRDESFGLGTYDSLNPNEGGLQGQGESKDLVWRSRANNLVNKWYFERSNGSIKIPPPQGSEIGFVLFWCDAEDKEERMKQRLQNCKDEEEKDHILEEERTKLRRWETIVGSIPSCWKPQSKESAS